MIRSSDIVSDIRGFNRFYTDILGLLDQHILDSGYSLTEARVLFEISTRELCAANMIVEQLGIDRSYMSRIVLKFDRSGLITKKASESDSRVKYIQLTDKGWRIFNDLNDKSNNQITDMLKPLNNEARKEIQDSMNLIRKNLTNAAEKPVIRSFTTGDIAWVTTMHKSLYASERHLSSDIFSKYIDDSVQDFTDNFDTEKDCMFILDYSDKPAGSVAIKHVDDITAQFRFFLIEPDARGLGAGRKMFDTAMAFCSEKGYKHVFLWTISEQKAARHIYQNYGFKLTQTVDNHEWGTDVKEECWALDL